MGKQGKKQRRKIQSEAADEKYKDSPHSFVIHQGEVSKLVKELVVDTRRVMEPFTGSRVKVRKNNVIKDFISVAGPLNVSHILVFTQTKTGLYLKLIKVPKGPTLIFKVHSFCLHRDVVSISRRLPSMNPKTFQTSPLLIMSGMSVEGKQYQLTSTLFQSLFPHLNVLNVNLNDTKRCVLLNLDKDTGYFDFRHYNISIVPRGLGKGVKKLLKRRIPNLGSYSDMSDYFLNAGNLSESEAELDPETSEVTLPQNMSGSGNIIKEKSGVRLREIGPRMSLELIKIEEGVCSGAVLFHAYESRSAEEIQALKSEQKAKKLEKIRRRKEQEKNVERKKEKLELHKQRSLAGMKRSRGDEDEKQESDDDDAEYYREEVGEEPNSDLFSTSKRRKDGSAHVSLGGGVAKKNKEHGDVGKDIERKRKKLVAFKEKLKKKQKLARQGMGKAPRPRVKGKRKVGDKKKTTTHKE